MKTNAFLVRVVICFLLSLIPATDLENRIYSTRMELRGHWGATPNVLIIDGAARALAAKIKESHPLQMIQISGSDSNRLIVDSDGVIRRANFKKPHFINYVGPAGAIPRCASDLKNCPPFQGKIILLNQESEESDRPLLYRTPLGEMDYAEIVANDLNTVVNHRPIYQASFFAKAVLILAMVLVGAVYIIYYPVLIGAISVIMTGVLLVFVIFQLVFMFFSVYIPSANISIALLITYLIFTGYRLAFQENLQWRSLKQAQYLRELDQMKTNFLSLVSHDLKTPIAKIQAVTERLKRELGEQNPYKDQIDSIENSTNELKHYILSILNLSRIESQKVILNKKSNDINLLIQQALKRLRPLAQQKNLVIEEKLEPLFSIECDEDLMRQVLSNLIDNAIKYSPENSKIIVQSREEEGFVRVDVEDFGPGIPKDQLPFMFRKFSRFIRPIKEQVKGTGLGLYLSKYFIELHGGKIRLHSVEGQGTTFTFTLPVQNG